ncbi:MAG: ABC-type transport auxiliary lipoprotein family protein [Desulfuromonas sp.]|nr:ABC-type transport auxiliary lipoprotein family protein [Desulfuromonas sp.]
MFSIVFVVNSARYGVLNYGLIQNFRTAAAFEAVIDTDSRIVPDYHLISDLRAFYSSYTHARNNRGNPVVEVEFDVQLTDAYTRTIVAQRCFSVVEPSSGTDVEVVVQAFNRATAILSAELLEWTTQSIAPHEG